jgi:hypothetical protein
LDDVVDRAIGGDRGSSEYGESDEAEEEFHGRVRGVCG